MSLVSGSFADSECTHLLCKYKTFPIKPSPQRSTNNFQYVKRNASSFFGIKHSFCLLNLILYAPVYNLSVMSERIFLCCKDKCVLLEHSTETPESNKMP